MPRPGFPVNPKIMQLMMCTLLALTMRTPVSPGAAPTPLMERPRNVTLMPAPLMMMPVVALARIEPKVPLPSSVTDLVMVTAPNPPGSRQSISPGFAVFEIAPANVLHGAVRLPGFASSPTPETHVRVAMPQTCTTRRRERQQDQRPSYFGGIGAGAPGTLSPAPLPIEWLLPNVA